MTEQRDRKRLRHIEQACREIQSFLGDKTKTEFLNDRLLQRAVEKDLEIIGEAANNLSEETREQLDAIPWDEIIGMRNILVHVYFEVDLDTVWKTIQEDIPTVIQALQQSDVIDH